LAGATSTKERLAVHKVVEKLADPHGAHDSMRSQLHVPGELHVAALLSAGNRKLVKQRGDRFDVL
jgi:hypothetical protein